MSEEPESAPAADASVEVPPEAVPAIDEIDPDQPVQGPRCTWCSALLETGEEASCPTCGANLSGGEAEIPGLTSVDPASVLRQRPVVQPRGLISWLNQDVALEEHPDIPVVREALEPPPADVKIEILRLQLEADRQQLLAEIEATPETIAAGLHTPSPLFSSIPINPSATSAEDAGPADAEVDTPEEDATGAAEEHATGEPG